jgi:two-component system sensor kinase FixL
MADFATNQGSSAGVPMADSGRLLRNTGAHYALAVGLVVFVFGVLAVMGSGISNQQLYLFLVPPVLVAGIVGGWGPGLLATVLALVGHLSISGEYAHLFQPGSPSFATEFARAFTFTLLGVGISWFGERLRASLLRAHQSAQDAAAREAHVQSILDTVPEAMIVIDERGTVQSFSAERTSGS